MPFEAGVPCVDIVWQPTRLLTAADEDALHRFHGARDEQRTATAPEGALSRQSIST